MLCNFSSDTRGNQPLNLSSLSRTHLNIIHLHPHRKENLQQKWALQPRCMHRSLSFPSARWPVPASRLALASAWCRWQPWRRKRNKPTSRRTPSRRSLGWNRNKFRAPPRKEASRRLDVNNFIDDYIKIYSSDCIIHPCFVVPTHPCVFKKKERKKREITDASRRWVSTRFVVLNRSKSLAWEKMCQYIFTFVVIL